MPAAEVRPHSRTHTALPASAATPPPPQEDAGAPQAVVTSSTQRQQLHSITTVQARSPHIHIPTTHCCQRLFIYCAAGGVGIRAHDGRRALAAVLQRRHAINKKRDIIVNKYK
jgi:hypothetical protein